PTSPSPTASQNAQGAPMVCTRRMLPPVQYGDGMPVRAVAAPGNLDGTGWGGIVVRPDPAGQRECAMAMPRRDMDRQIAPLTISLRHEVARLIVCCDTRSHG